ncbi:MAG: ankyrin repeat domain-containing protein [Chlamydiia bacterium]|nr:ankyrin repeat domain-containing protein [Chlamydiia bacterium]
MKTNFDGSGQKAIYPLACVSSTNLSPRNLDSLRKALLPPAVYASRTAYQEPYPLLKRALVAHAVPEALELLEQIPAEQLEARDCRGCTVAARAIRNDCDDKILKVVLSLKPTQESVRRCSCRGPIKAEVVASNSLWGIACRLGKRAAMQQLIQPKLMEELDREGNSALHIACRAEAEAGALLLADSVSSSTINLRNKQRCRALDIALHTGKEEVAISLLARRLDIDLSPDSMECVQLLTIAAEHGLEQVCLFLSELISPFLKQGETDQEQRQIHWTKATYWTINNNMHRAFAQLVPNLPESVCDMIRIEDKVKMELLQAAAAANNVPALSALMDRFMADESWNTYYLRNTPIHAAVGQGAVDACKELIARLPPEALLQQNGRGHTALHVASQKGEAHIEAYRALLHALPDEALRTCAIDAYFYQLSWRRGSIALDILKATPMDQLMGTPNLPESVLLSTAKEIGCLRKVPVKIATLLRERMHPADFEIEAKKARELIRVTLSAYPARPRVGMPLKYEVEKTANKWLSVLTPPLRAKAAE